MNDSRRAKHLRKERERRERRAAGGSGPRDAVDDQFEQARAEMLASGNPVSHISALFTPTGLPEVDTPVISTGLGRATWVLCNDCDVPFQTQGFDATWVAESPTATVAGVELGPCPRCEGMGRPLETHQVSEAGYTVASTDPARAAEELRDLIELLDAGAEVSEVLTVLEERGGVLAELAQRMWPLATRFGRDLVIGVLSSLITLLVTGMPLSAEDIERIIDEHATQSQAPQSPTPPASSTPPTPSPQHGAAGPQRPQ